MDLILRMKVLELINFFLRKPQISCIIVGPKS